MVQHNPDASCSTVDTIIAEQQLALRLSKVLGRTPESWLSMQDNYELWQAKKTLNLDGVHPLNLDVA